MIVGVGTDFEITITGGLFKVAWENNDFVFKVSIPLEEKWLWSSEKFFFFFFLFFF